MKKKKSGEVALVLSGGGARGLAHIGVIEELTARGYRIRSIAGCSIGSVVGGLYAVGKLEDYKNWILPMDKIDILRLVDFTLSGRGLIKGERIFERLGELGMIPEVDIQDLPLPFAAVAVDIRGNREVVFRSGSLPNAIRASIGIPSVFTPVPQGDLLLVDGGVLNPLPLEHADRKKGDILVAVDLTSLIPYDKPILADQGRKIRPHSKKIAALLERWDALLGNRDHAEQGGRKDREIGYFNLVTRSVQLMQHGLTRCALERNPPDVLIQIAEESAGLFEFYKAQELVAYGRERCAEALDRWEG